MTTKEFAKILQDKLTSEYGVELRMEGLPYAHLRRVERWEGDIKELVLCTDSRVLEDFRGHFFVAYGGEWSLNYLTKNNPGLTFADQLTV